MTRRSPDMTSAELDAIDTTTVDLTTAGRALGLGRSKAHEMARAGEFPVPVLRLGTRWRVPTAELRRLLSGHPSNGTADPSG